MSTSDPSAARDAPAQPDRRKTPSDAALRVCAILLQGGEAVGNAAALIAQHRAVEDVQQSQLMLTGRISEASDSSNALRDAARVCGAHLRAAGVQPEELVPAIRLLIGGRRATDVHPAVARLSADVVTWAIQGYYGEGNPAP